MCSNANENNDQDLKILYKVIIEIKGLSLNSEVILKSTVLPNSILDIQKHIPNIVYNPEFLTEANAFEDFMNADLIVLGGNKNIVKKANNFYINQTKCDTQNVILTDLVSASLIKYTINSYLASKVMFFNELHNLFNLSGTDES